MPNTLTNKQRTTVSIGGATIDLFVRLKEDTEKNVVKNNAFILPLGEKLSLRSAQEFCGGGASNTSVGLARLGCTSRFIGILASDSWGELQKTTLEREHVSTEHAVIVEGETSGFSLILLPANGERTILTHSGVNSHLHDATFDLQALKDTDAIYLNHLCEAACSIEDDIAISISTLPCFVTWNPGGCQIHAGMDEPKKRALLANTDLLLLNKEEALKFTNTQDERTAIRRLLDAGVANICVTDGAKGVLATDGTTLYHCPSTETTVLDATGAGDAFGVGVSWGLLHGKSLPDSLIAGTLNAVSVVGVLGAQGGLLTKNQLQDRLQQTSLQVNVLPW